MNIKLSIIGTVTRYTKHQPIFSFGYVVTSLVRPMQSFFRTCNTAIVTYSWFSIEIVNSFVYCVITSLLTFPVVTFIPLLRIRLSSTNKIAIRMLAISKPINSFVNIFTTIIANLFYKWLSIVGSVTRVRAKNRILRNPIPFNIDITSTTKTFFDGSQLWPTIVETFAGTKFLRVLFSPKRVITSFASSFNHSSIVPLLPTKGNELSIS